MQVRAAALVLFLVAAGSAPAGPEDYGAPLNSRRAGSEAAPVFFPSRFLDQESPPKAEEPDIAVAPRGECPPAPLVLGHRLSCWPEIWGFVGVRGFVDGEQLAPNGLTFAPLFTLDTDFNLSILPNKKLYLFIDTSFWAQKATNGVTNPRQGSFDFSKREFDFSGGAAWNYWGPLEFRFSGFANNNLNRGISPNLPYGYNDGVGLENRLYLPGADIYDVGKLSFLSVGYMPSKTLVGLDGNQFKPGLLLHGYLTWDLPMIRSYLYCDGQYLGEAGVKPRLLLVDGGLAIRPFPAAQSLEFRIGAADTYDVQVRHGLGLGYLGIRVQY